MDFKTKNGLPNKPSELIRLALHDMKACEDDANYRIVMSSWHRPSTRGIPYLTRRAVCEVCLAGSVMAKTLGIDRTVAASYLCCNDPSEDTSNKLLALEHFRNGSLRMGVSYMCGNEGVARLPASMHKKSIVAFDHDPDAFRATMNVFANVLQKVGL